MGTYLVTHPTEVQCSKLLGYVSSETQCRGDVWMNLLLRLYGSMWKQQYFTETSANS